MRYFEDFSIGGKQSFGSYSVTREEVIEFASKYDPQDFHLSDEAAAKTFFGKVAASGWHTCSMAMAMIVENMKSNRQASLGSPGVDDIRWLTPVYPGDTLRCENEVLDMKRSRSKPEMGALFMKLTVYNQNDKPVMTMESVSLTACKIASE